jgi:hypothetical protein
MRLMLGDDWSDQSLPELAAGQPELEQTPLRALANLQVNITATYTKNLVQPDMMPPT